MIDDHAVWDNESLGRAARLADWMFDQFSWAAKGAVVEIRAGVGTFSALLLAAGVESPLLIEPDGVCADVLAESFATDPRVSIARVTLVRACRPIQDRVRPPWGLSLVAQAEKQ